MELDVATPFEGFLMRESIWKRIEEVTSESTEERTEVKKIIGESLIDESLELHKEVSTLYEIWKDFNQKLHKERDPIPEPPFVRESLEKQITVLVELLKEKLLIQGKRSLAAVLSHGEREIVDSVSRGNSHDKRERSHLTSCGNDTIVPNFSRSSSSLSVDSIALRDNENMFEIENLATALREDFEDERKNLISDIEKIQQALICGSELKEKQLRRKLSSPTIAELRHLNHKLESEVLPNNVNVPLKATKNSDNTGNMKWSNNFQKLGKLKSSVPLSANMPLYSKHSNLPSIKNLPLEKVSTKGL